MDCEYRTISNRGNCERTSRYKGVEECWRELAGNVVWLAASDYLKSGCKDKSIVRFFHSEYFNLISELDGEEVLENLKAYHKKTEEKAAKKGGRKHD